VGSHRVALLVSFDGLASARVYPLYLWMPLVGGAAWLRARVEAGRDCIQTEARAPPAYRVGIASCERRWETMEWLGWILGVIAVFVLWDLFFCGGQRCRGLIDRL